MFFTFFNCTIGTKLRNAPHIAEYLKKQKQLENEI